VELSLVIPVYNGESFIGDSVDRAHAFLDERFDDYEIVVADDGSTDGTRDAVTPRLGERLRLVSMPSNVGKYGALQAAMAQCRGRCRVFTDADLPYDLEAIRYVSELINGRDFHVVVGDRNLADSESHVRQPLLRRVTTHSYSFLVRMLVTGGLFDTQCGLKGFRDDVADALFPLIRNLGFSGDVEILYVALKYNLEIKRIPVRLRRAAPSTVRMAVDATSMLLRIVGLRRRWLGGCYHSEALTRIAGQRYWEGPPR
jgi:dolichyl-phosphate beta-glucosyltransferase